MNVKTAKKPESRIDTNYLSKFKMSTFGNDNLYPQTIASIAASSGTATLCLNRYAKFIEGNGFKNVDFAEVAVNRSGDTADSILHLLSQDLAKFGGLAIHVNYNLLGEIVEIQHVPFENCRLEEEDENGYVSHILIHPDWRGKKTRNGVIVKVDSNNVDRINVFNPRKNVVLSQIDKAGGLEYYKGQVLWVSMAGSNTYPLAIYDSVITEMSTDEGLSNIKNRNTRNSFLVSCMLVVKKGSPRINDNGEEVETKLIEADDLKRFQGDTNGNKIMLVELEQDEEEPKIVPFTTANYDKDFTVTDNSTVERIYAAFSQELFYAIRIGKLGFSGQVMRDAYEYYAGQVTNEQRFIERAFDKVFRYWYVPVNPSMNFSIQPIKYMNSDGNTSDNQG
ncbi:hypothetical protein [Bacteroides neonati]|uniref:hypothetical protein n=1 Tax=Bacteroides neonati TaxID=1347393 RepID=UPI0005AA3B10|nr:hypothetical protein [Bacteroides neonati]